MDCAYFLRDRTMLIRHFYDTAAAPFVETKRAIEACDPPYDHGRHSESNEPPYLGEWLQAETERQLVGRACVSMLAESLKQYFHDQEREIHRFDSPCREGFPTVFKRSFVFGYATCFAEALGMTVGDFPVDLCMIEQVVLARNVVQHATIHWPHAMHDEKSRMHYQQPFFVREAEAWPDDGSMPFLSPTLHVEREKLFAACDEIDKLGTWLQAEIGDRFFGHRTPTD